MPPEIEVLFKREAGQNINSYKTVFLHLTFLPAIWLEEYFNSRPAITPSLLRMTEVAFVCREVDFLPPLDIRENMYTRI